MSGRRSIYKGCVFGDHSSVHISVGDFWLIYMSSQSSSFSAASGFRCVHAW